LVWVVSVGLGFVFSFTNYLLLSYFQECLFINLGRF